MMKNTMYYVVMYLNEEKRKMEVSIKTLNEIFESGNSDYTTLFKSDNLDEATEYYNKITTEMGPLSLDDMAEIIFKQLTDLIECKNKNNLIDGDYKVCNVEVYGEDRIGTDIVGVLVQFMYNGKEYYIQRECPSVVLLNLIQHKKDSLNLCYSEMFSVSLYYKMRDKEDWVEIK